MGSWGECPPTTNCIYFKTQKRASGSKIDTICRGPLPLVARGCETPQDPIPFFPNCAKQEPFHPANELAGYPYYVPNGTKQCRRYWIRRCDGIPFWGSSGKLSR